MAPDLLSRARGVDDFSAFGGCEYFPDGEVIFPPDDFSGRAGCFGDLRRGLDTADGDLDGGVHECRGEHELVDAQAVTFRDGPELAHGIAPLSKAVALEVGMVLPEIGKGFSAVVLSGEQTLVEW